MIWTNGSASLNEFYDLINVKSCQIGDRLGISDQDIQAYGVRSLQDFLDPSFEIVRMRSGYDQDKLMPYMVLDWRMPDGSDSLNPLYKD